MRNSDFASIYFSYEELQLLGINLDKRNISDKDVAILKNIKENIIGAYQIRESNYKQKRSKVGQFGG